MRLLLLSNSRQPGQSYLEHAHAALAGVLGGVDRALFIPYAAVSLAYADYAAKVSAALGPLSCRVESIDTCRDPVAALAGAGAIIVGGGNTFHLLRECRRRGLLAAIAARVREGVPYVGWSAGANLAGPSIRATNDMPICDPGGFEALGLAPCLINPHYTNEVPPGWQGETRDQRIGELLLADPSAVVVGVPEGAALDMDGRSVHVRLLATARPCRLFRGGHAPFDCADGCDLAAWLQKSPEMPRG